MTFRLHRELSAGRHGIPHSRRIHDDLLDMARTTRTSVAAWEKQIRPLRDALEHLVHVGESFVQIEPSARTPADG
jgi:hypothetical protein